MIKKLSVYVRMLCVKQTPERKSDRSNHPLTTANGNVTRHPGKYTYGVEHYTDVKS